MDEELKDVLSEKIRQEKLMAKYNSKLISLIDEWDPDYE